MTSLLVAAGLILVFTGPGWLAILCILAALTLYAAEHIAERNGL